MVAVLAAAELLVADAIQVVSMFLPSQWGIFTMSGSPVITGKVLGVAYRKSWRTADFPVEQNSFASYNKAEEPWEARVQFAVDGSTPLGSYVCKQRKIINYIVGMDKNLMCGYIHMGR